MIPHAALVNGWPAQQAAPCSWKKLDGTFCMLPFSERPKLYLFRGLYSDWPCKTAMAISHGHNGRHSTSDLLLPHN